MADLHITVDASRLSRELAELAGVPYDGKLTKADGKGTWWEGLDPQDLYEQRHTPGLDFDVPLKIHERWDWGNGDFVPFNVLRQPYDPHTTALLALEAMLRVWPELTEAPLFQTLFLSSMMVLIANRLPITYTYQLLSDPAFRHGCLLCHGRHRAERNGLGPHGPWLGPPGSGHRDLNPLWQIFVHRPHFVRRRRAGEGSQFRDIPARHAPLAIEGGR